MSNYTPDKWIVIDLPEYNTKKVLSGFSGGYLYGNSWRLSSGITLITFEEPYYVIHNESGSIYTCHKANYGVNIASSGILEKIKEDTSTLVLSIEEVMHG